MPDKNLSDVSVWDLVEMDIPPPEWQVNGVVPYTSDGQVRMLITGVPKAGKSRLLTDLLFSITSGHRFVGEFDVMRVSPVLYINEENTLAMFRRRFVELTAMAHLGEYVPADGDAFTTPQLEWFRGVGRQSLQPFRLWVRRGVGLPMFRSSLDEDEWFDSISDSVRQIRENAHSTNLPLGKPWVIFDTLGKVVQTAEWSSYEQVNAVLEMVNDLGRRLDVNVAIVHHSNKSHEAHGDARVLGSTALPGWYDAHLQIVKKHSDGTLEIRREFREHEAPETVWFVEDKHHSGELSEVTSWQASYDSPKKGGSYERIKQVLMAPGGGWLARARDNATQCAKDLAEAFDDIGALSESTVRQHVAKAVRELEVE